MAEEEERKVVVRRSYLDTPIGKKVATYDFAESLLEAIKVLDEDLARLEERVNGLEKGGNLAKTLEELDSRLTSMEETLKGLEKSIEVDLADLTDKISALIDAFHELAERVQRLEDAMIKG